MAISMHDLVRRLKQDAYAKANGGDVEATDEWKAAVELEAWRNTFPQYEFDGASNVRRKPESLPPHMRPKAN